MAGMWPMFQREQGAELGLERRAPSLYAGHVVWALGASGT